MKKARKSIVVAMLGLSMLTYLSGCTATGCNATHPFTTMFQGHDPLALNSPPAFSDSADDAQQTTASNLSQDQTQL